MLRSKNVLLVKNEIYVLLIFEQLLCTVISEVTNAAPGVDPDRASFTLVLETARDTVLAGPPLATSSSIPPGADSGSGWRVLAGPIGAQILDRLLPPCRLRTGGRDREAGDLEIPGKTQRTAYPDRGGYGRYPPHGSWFEVDGPSLGLSNRH